MKRRMDSSRDDHRRRMRPPPPPPPPPLLDPSRDLLLGPSYSDYLRDYSNRSMTMSMPPYPSTSYSYDPLAPFPHQYTPRLPPPAPPLSSHRLGDYPPPPLSPLGSSRREREHRDHRDRDRMSERRARRGEHRSHDRSRRERAKDRERRMNYERSHADECEDFVRRTSGKSYGSGGYGSSRHGGRR
ncbi:uncharacterized protein [Diadema setosum]